MGILKVRVTAVDGPAAVAEFGGRTFPCVVGRTGVVAAEDKREGDGKTPLGYWPLVGGFFRPDHARALGVCQQELAPGMGWCDASGDDLYNQMCATDYPASHEDMWGIGAPYDYVGIMDYNLDGAVAPDGKGRGSAIFLHVWVDGATHTAGCVALRKADLEAVLEGGVTVVDVTLA